MERRRAALSWVLDVPEAQRRLALPAQLVAQLASVARREMVRRDAMASPAQEALALLQPLRAVLRTAAARQVVAVAVELQAPSAARMAPQLVNRRALAAENLDAAGTEVEAPPVHSMGYPQSAAREAPQMLAVPLDGAGEAVSRPAKVPAASGEGALLQARLLLQADAAPVAPVAPVALMAARVAAVSLVSARCRS